MAQSSEGLIFQGLVLSRFHCNREPLHLVINPRCACVRVMVVSLCVCMLPDISLYTCLYMLQITPAIKGVGGDEALEMLGSEVTVLFACMTDSIHDGAKHF